MRKRARQDSAGPFLSRLDVADILSGEIDHPGGFIEGRIYSTISRKNQYTIDIRTNLNGRPIHLDVVIEDKLLRKFGELLVGDYLRILLQGAHILPHSNSPTRLPVILRYMEGITVLLVSRAGPQGEKEKLLSVWPNSSEHSILASVGYNDLLLQSLVKPKREKAHRTSTTSIRNGFPHHPRAMEILV